MNFYGLGQRDAFEKFAVSYDWINKKLQGGLASRMTRLGPGAAAQSAQEFSARQGARAEALPPKLKEMHGLERLFNLGVNLFTLPLSVATLSKPLMPTGAWKDVNERSRDKRLTAQKRVNDVLGPSPGWGLDKFTILPRDVQAKYDQGLKRPNKPESLLTGDRLKDLVGPKPEPIAPIAPGGEPSLDQHEKRLRAVRHLRAAGSL